MGHTKALSDTEACTHAGVTNEQMCRTQPHKQSGGYTDSVSHRHVTGELDRLKKAGHCWSNEADWVGGRSEASNTYKGGKAGCQGSLMLTSPVI